MKKIWNETAWEEYLFWQNQDRKTLRKINKLINEIERSGSKSIGHAEQLKGDLKGWSSVNIDKKNRLVYRISGKDENKYLEILQCKTHYEKI